MAASWISTEKITCQAPSVSYPVNISLALHFEGSTGFVESTQHFAYHQQLSLEDASPMRGFVNGDTIVTITGTGFLDVPSLRCLFGSVVVQAMFRSPNLIECSSPPVAHSQCVELLVSLNGMDFSSFTAVFLGRGMFTYDDEIELFRTVPSNIGGSSAFSVMGHSFLNTTTLACRVGSSEPTPAQYISDSEVRCHLPKTSELGEADVGISLNGVDFSRKLTSVAFVKPALISSISPHRIQEGEGHSKVPRLELRLHG